MRKDAYSNAWTFLTGQNPFKIDDYKKNAGGKYENIYKDAEKEFSK